MTPPKPDMFDKIETVLDETDRARFSCLLGAILGFGVTVGVCAAKVIGFFWALVFGTAILACAIAINYLVKANREAFNEHARDD